ncbi:MAG: T9SS type A sorting domain-containing protein, partial [Candidatus Kapabacteria bacterium]|nr:T9SS type A sorting domain-containing protein [Candidatus Kapabacteria bacterium]
FMKRAFLFIVAIALLLLDASPLWTQEEMELELVWEIQYPGGNQTREQVCKKGKFLVNSSDGEWYLYDLNTGELIYKTTKGDEQHYLMVNDLGDKFYIRNLAVNTFEEYDIQTKELIQKLPHVLDGSNGYYYNLLRISSDNVYFEFHEHPHSFVFKDLYTGTVLDSFKVPNSPDQSTFGMNGKGEFSYDGRYFKFGLKNKFSSEAGTNWFVYDRQAKEIVFQRYVDKPSYGPPYSPSFYNTSNKLIEIFSKQFPEDDKAYSYIHIYDLDSRALPERAKLSDREWNGRMLIRPDDKVILHRDSDSKSYLFDLEKLRPFNLKSGLGMTYFDNEYFWYHGGHILRKYSMDWSVGIGDATNMDDQILYPNPTTGAITLAIDEAMFGGQWQIIDINGRKLKQGLIGFTNNLLLNIESLQTGTYILNLQKDSIVMKYKILLQR